MSLLDKIRRGFAYALTNDPETERAIKNSYDIGEALQNGVREVARARGEYFSSKNSFTQKTLVGLEVLALEEAKKVRILGFDTPIMTDPRYIAAILQAKKRGADITAYINRNHADITAEFFPPEIELILTEDSLPNSRGWRDYSNRISDTIVMWDSNRRSPIEPDVLFRTFRHYPVGTPDPDYSRIRLFDKSPVELSHFLTSGHSHI